MKTCLILALLAVAVLLTSAASQNDESVHAILARVPENARAKPNPLAADHQAAAAGRKLFEQHCAECHGEKGEGKKRGPSLRAPQLQQATPGELFWIVTNGSVRRGMPAWSKLPEPQRWQIITFLAEWNGESAGTEPAR